MTQAITIHNFQTTVMEYYWQHGRHDLPWRQPEANGTLDPYKIMVSELMLQQTQVVRVLPKYDEFLKRFPAIQQLAAAELGDVLRTWSGLGYNRRAKFLHAAAQQIVDEYDGVFPHKLGELIKLPGIGKNTAGAILAYAFNEQAIFLETNIRTVFIHHFFNDSESVADSELIPFVAEALEGQEPREWYWALMDYGSHLKRSVGNVGRYSKHYVKQSAFQGSKRQVRGQVLRLLGTKPLSLREITEHITDERLAVVLQDLLAEGLIHRHGERYSL